MLRGAVFQPKRIGDIVFKNRFMCSACNLESMEGGRLLPEYLKHFEEMAEGDCGLIVPGFCYPLESGKGSPRQTPLCREEHADFWKECIANVHRSGSKLILQVCHGGVYGIPHEDGSPITGPSEYGPGTRAMTKQEIEEVIQSYRNAARLCKKAGADGIQIHVAHGFLLSEFLSPIFNRRNDEYGGSLMNRARILREIVEEVKSECSPSFLLTMKINGSDCVRGGNSPKDIAEVLRNIPGFDLVEVSCGISGQAIATSPLKRMPKNLPADKAAVLDGFYKSIKENQLFKPMFNREYARIIKAANPNLNIASVGGYRKLSEMNDVIASGDADFVSLGRPFIRQPQLVKDLANGAKRVDCVNCSMCIAFLNDFPPIRCYMNELH